MAAFTIATISGLAEQPSQDRYDTVPVHRLQTGNIDFVCCWLLGQTLRASSSRGRTSALLTRRSRSPPPGHNANMVLGFIAGAAAVLAGHVLLKLKSKMGKKRTRVVRVACGVKLQSSTTYCWTSLRRGIRSELRQLAQPGTAMHSV
jgi:hypothetical protein